MPVVSIAENIFFLYDISSCSSQGTVFACRTAFFTRTVQAGVLLFIVTRLTRIVSLRREPRLAVAQFCQQAVPVARPQASIPSKPGSFLLPRWSMGAVRRGARTSFPRSSVGTIRIVKDTGTHPTGLYGQMRFAMERSCAYNDKG